MMLAAHSGYAQQQALFSQYMFNGLVLNPAYAGSHEALSITALARKQWIGVDGAPSTQTISAHSPVRNEKIALGLTIVNDKIGVTRQSALNAVYAYRITFKNKGKLSMGLQGGLTQVTSQFSRLTAKTANDPTFASDDVSKLLPNFGTGVFYSTDKFYMGFSIPYLVNNLLKDTNVALNSRQRRYYLLNGGYVFRISDDFKLKPSFLLQFLQNTPPALDLNANLLIREVLWLGLSYRVSSSLNFITQVQLTDQLSFGYSYDVGLNGLSKVNNGSHEVMLNYKFTFIKSKVVTPRDF